MARITWTRGRFWDSGEVGGMELFRIHTLNDKYKPHAALVCRLPHVEPGRVEDDNRDKLRQTAEGMLSGFVARLGATFPDP